METNTNTMDRKEREEMKMLANKIFGDYEDHLRLKNTYDRSLELAANRIDEHFKSAYEKI